MPHLDPDELDQQRRVGKERWVRHLPPFDGNKFDVPGKWKESNQPSALIGAGTDSKASSLRPLPGARPIGPQYGKRHPGRDPALRTPVSGVSVWVCEDRPGLQPVYVAVKHDDSDPATARASAYPNEIIRLKGASLRDRPRVYRPHLPLVDRNADGTVDFNSLLAPVSGLGMVEYQPVPLAPNVMVVSGDNNWMRAVSASDSEPGIELRQFGLNVPRGPIGTIEPIDASAKALYGPQLFLRKQGETTWHDDPDHEWNLGNGEYLEVDIGRVWGPVVGNIRQECGIVVAVLELASGTLTSATINFRGTVHDPTTGAQSAITGSSDSVSVSALTTCKDSRGATVHQNLNVEYTTNYRSANRFRYDEFNANGHKYPRIYWNNATGNLQRVVAFRSGVKLNADDEPTQWKFGWGWERRFGSYVVRSGHSAQLDEFPSTIPANHSARCREFGASLSTEYPDALNVVMNKRTVNVFEADKQGIASKAFYVARDIKVRRSTASSISVASFSVSGGVVTITTSGNHDFVTHDLLTIAVTGAGGITHPNVLTPTDRKARIIRTGDTTFTYTPDWATPTDTAGGAVTNTNAARGADYTVTDTGYPEHDMNVDRIVVDCWHDEGDVFEGQDIVPGGCLALGGCTGVVAHQSRVYAWGIPRYSFRTLTFVRNSKTVTSTVDTFRGWMIGRELVVGGDMYYISRVVREVPNTVDPAELELTRAWDRDGGSHKAYLAEKFNVLYWTFSDPPYAEVSHSLNQAVLPDAADQILTCLPDGDSLVVFCRKNIYRFFTDQSIENIYTENVVPQAYSWRLVSTDHGAASPNSVALVEGQVAAFTGRGISIGHNPENLVDVTFDGNSRLFRGDLLAPDGMANANVGYDQTTRRLLLANLQSISPTYPRQVEWAVDMDLSTPNRSMSLAYPFLARAIGNARTPVIPYADEARVRDTILVAYVDVDTVGTGATATRTGPHIFIYDFYGGVKQAIYVGDGDDTPLTYGISSHAAAAPTGSRSTLQRPNGNLVCQLSDAVLVELARSAAGVWSVVDFMEGVSFTQATFHALAAPLRGDSLYALSEVYDGGTSGATALTEFDSGTIRVPYIPGVGGRYAELRGASFVWANVHRQVLLGPGGEIILLGRTTNKIVVKRIDVYNFEEMFDDVEFTATSIASIKCAGVNRHGDIFVVWGDGTDHHLSRIIMPDKGIEDGLIATLTTFQPTSGMVALHMDSRQQAWLAYSMTTGGERRVAVQRWLESNTTPEDASPVELYRDGYHRDLVSLVQAHHYHHYLFRDTNAADSDDVEYRLVRAIGETERTETFPDATTLTFHTGDGTPYIDGALSGTEDADSVYDDLAELVAGTGGALGYARLDDQFIGGKPVACQAVPTCIIGHRGPVSS